MNISSRIEKIASRIAFLRIADIGTDHGYLPIFALQNKLATSAVASDVNEQPLLRARENAEAAGLTDIEFRPGYGLDVLQPGEVDTIVIAGMGGKLMADILQRGRDVALGASQLLLSPHLDVPFVRREVHEMGCNIYGEELVYDEGKYYSILDVRTSGVAERKYSEEEYLLGRHMLDARSPVFVEYCRHMAARYGDIVRSIERAPLLGQEAKVRLAEAMWMCDTYRKGGGYDK